MTPKRLLITLFPLVVGGCAPATRTTATPRRVPTPSNGLSTWEKDFVGCHGMGPIFAVDLDRAQQLLPEGFKAKDANGLAQVPAGYCAGSIWTVTCPDGKDSTRVMLLVEPPDPELPEVLIEWYTLALFVADASEAERLRAAGYAPQHGDISAAWSISDRVIAEMSLETAEGPLITVAAEAEKRRIDIERVPQRRWHEVGGRVTYFDVDYPPHHPWIGKPTASSIRAGSVVHELVGGDALSASPQVIVEILEDGDYHSRLVVHPGLPTGEK